MRSNLIVIQSLATSPPILFFQEPNAPYHLQKIKTMPHCHWHQLALDAYIALLRLKNYSPNTIQNYKNWFLLFLHYFPDRKPSGISKNDILDFMVNCKD